MKISLFGIAGVPVGKHNIKDARLDQADKLVEAKKKVYAQVDVLSPEHVQEADAVVVLPESREDLILEDLEFIETRLGRAPAEDEKLVLEKIKTALENDGTAYQTGLSPEEKAVISAHNLKTSRPIILARQEEIADFDHLLVRIVQEGNHISFLTVGGKENRAWLIRNGATAWEAAGSVHSDIQKGFIRAEIISFDDFIQAGGETQAKRAGKVRLETKQYVMKDYDLANFRFNK